MRQPSLTDQDKLLLDRIDDFINKASEKYIPQFSHFVDERQANIAVNHLISRGCSNYLLWGGHKQAERNILCVYPPSEELANDAFPISTVTFVYRDEDKLSHRDFLGAIMNLMIKREYVGDILVGEGLAVVYAEEKIAPLLINEVSKIGRTGVKVYEGLPFGMPEARGFQEIQAIVNSLRLDVIVAAITKLSREKASQLIRSGAVSVASCQCQEVSSRVEFGSRVSIKGYGRFFIEDCGRTTKKGRLHLLIKKYL